MKRKLLSCIAITAVSLGVLGAGHYANAAIIVFEFSPPVVASTAGAAASSGDFHHDHNWLSIAPHGVGGDDNILRVYGFYSPSLHRNSDDSAGAGQISIENATVLAPGAPGTHVQPFPAGETIGPGNTVSPKFLSTPYDDGGYFLNGGQFGSGYVGFTFTRPSGTYYGWLEVETNTPGEPVAEATITRLAFDNSPGTSIRAGDTGEVIPEPTSSALLAAGALAMTRRKKVA